MYKVHLHNCVCQACDLCTTLPSAAAKPTLIRTPRSQCVILVRCRRSHAARAQQRAPLAVRAAASKEFDYDLVIIGCGVGGHGAALHAVECVSAGITQITQVCITHAETRHQHGGERACPTMHRA